MQINEIKNYLNFYLLALLDSILIFFSISDFIVKIIALILSLISSFILLHFYVSENKNLEKKIAYYSFLSSFFESIQQGQSIKNAYENATRYLFGYTTIKTLDELKESKDLLFDNDYSSLFYETLEKDDNNEAHLLNYQALIIESDEIIDNCSETLKNTNKDTNMYLIFYSFVLLIILISTLIFSPLAELTLNLNFCFAFIPLAFLPSSLIYSAILKIKELNK